MIKEINNNVIEAKILTKIDEKYIKKINENCASKCLFDKEDDMEIMFQKCKISIEKEMIPPNQKKINHFFKPISITNKKTIASWTKRDEVKYFGNDKRKKEFDRQQ